MKNSKSHFRGCLLGGAVGDALGYPVEELKREEILKAYGSQGVMDTLKHGEEKTVLVSDDTQMSVFTVDGLLWADARAKEKGIYAYTPCIFYAYQKWLYTQTGNFADKNYEFLLRGEILRWEELFARRNPGKTSLATLSGCINGKYGTPKKRVNHSKGSGAVMRAAPVGLYFCNDATMAFQIGMESGAITHGHSCGFLPAGYLAFLIARLIRGADLEQAAVEGLFELRRHKDHQETHQVIEKAILYAQEEHQSLERDLAILNEIGNGFTGEEAIAGALYCALRHRDSFENALRLAVNTDGDSDTLGAICGNILGAFMGSLEIPFKWLSGLELYDLLIYGADKLQAAVNH